MRVLYKQKGFTLVEGMISLFLMCIGMLGAAYMQVYSSTSVAQIKYRSAAAAIAGELATQVMVDAKNLGCYSYQPTITLPSTINGNASTCNSTVATLFMTNWKAKLVDPKIGLPVDATGNYKNTVDIDANGLVTITLQWTLARDKAVQTDANGNNIPHKYILTTQVA